jgi:hypothetical protein
MLTADCRLVLSAWTRTAAAGWRGRACAWIIRSDGVPAVSRMLAIERLSLGDEGFHGGSTVVTPEGGTSTVPPT